MYRLGFMLRETGQALDRLGSSVQGIYAFREQREWALHPLHPKDLSYFFATCSESPTPPSHHLSLNPTCLQ
jgi:hypothetical protein